MLSAYEVNVMYPMSGLGAVAGRTRQPLITLKRPIVGLHLTQEDLAAAGAQGTSSLVLVGAIAGVGILAYVAAKALKK